MKQLIIILLALITLTSCTSNSRARHWGGTETIDLNPNQRVVNVTWKENGLWILTKQDTTNPTTYTFEEKSSFGLMEGKVIIIEK